MKALLIIFFSVTISIQAFSCECPELALQELDKESYEWSEVVLTGNLVKAGKRYKVTVSEVLKGEVDASVLFGLTEDDEEILVCTFVPQTNGEYLLYLKIEKECHWGKDLLLLNSMPWLKTFEYGTHSSRFAHRRKQRKAY